MDTTVMNASVTTRSLDRPMHFQFPDLMAWVRSAAIWIATCSLSVVLVPMLLMVAPFSFFLIPVVAPFWIMSARGLRPYVGGLYEIRLTSDVRRIARQIQALATRSMRTLVLPPREGL